MASAHGGILQQPNHELHSCESAQDSTCMTDTLKHSSTPDSLTDRKDSTDTLDGQSSSNGGTTRPPSARKLDKQITHLELKIRCLNDRLSGKETVTHQRYSNASTVASSGSQTARESTSSQPKMSLGGDRKPLLAIPKLKPVTAGVFSQNRLTASSSIDGWKRPQGGGVDRTFGRANTVSYPSSSSSQSGTVKQFLPEATVKTYCVFITNKDYSEDLVKQVTKALLPVRGVVSVVVNEWAHEGKRKAFCVLRAKVVFDGGFQSIVNNVLRHAGVNCFVLREDALKRYEDLISPKDELSSSAPTLNSAQPQGEVRRISKNSLQRAAYQITSAREATQKEAPWIDFSNMTDRNLPWVGKLDGSGTDSEKPQKPAQSSGPSKMTPSPTRKRDSTRKRDLAFGPTPPELKGGAPPELKGGFNITRTEDCDQHFHTEGCEQDAEFAREERGIKDSVDYEERGIEKELLNEDRGVGQLAFCNEERAEVFDSEERRTEKLAFCNEERGIEEAPFSEERRIEKLAFCEEERGTEEAPFSEERRIEKLAFCDEERGIEEVPLSEERRIEKLAFCEEERGTEEVPFSEERRIEKLASVHEERGMEEAPFSGERRIEGTDERREDASFDPEERENEEINYQRGDSDEYTMDSYNTDDDGEKKAALFGQWVSGVDAEDESEGGYLDNVVDGKLDDAMMLSFFSQSATTFGFDRAKTLSQKFRGTVVPL